MSEYIPIQELNVTNVFPTEPAPPGLNYYVAVKELPYAREELHYSRLRDWNTFLYKAYLANNNLEGLRTSEAFDAQWAYVQYMTAADQDRVHDLGYNPIYRYSGVGPVIWGNEVVGTDWRLPQLMIAVEVMTNIQHAINGILPEFQSSLFVSNTLEEHRIRSTINNVLYRHQIIQDLYYPVATEPVVHVRDEHDGVRYFIPIQPLMFMEPLVFEIKLWNGALGCEYRVAKETTAEYRAMQQLFHIRDYGITLEDE
jgi:hypothetical protein